MKLYGVCCVVYCSSHDDFIALFSSEDRAEKAAGELNAKEGLRLAALDNTPIENFKFPYNSPPYYVREFDVSKWESYYYGEKFPRKWKAIYSVPSIGEFQIVPSSICIEEYTLNEMPTD